MSILTKGFVCTGNKPVIEVLRLVEKALKNHGDAVCLPVRVSEMNITTSGSVYVNFVIGDYNPRTKSGAETSEFRTLAVNFECDADHKEVYSGQKITFSMGNYGSSHQVMSAILKKVSWLGTCYYNPNDSLEDNWSEFKL